MKQKLCELLLQKGADIKAKDDDGRSPLHDAADSFNQPTIEVITRALALAKIDPTTLRSKSGEVASTMSMTTSAAIPLG